MEHVFDETEAERLRYERDELAKLILGEHLFEVAKRENLPVLTAVRILREGEVDRISSSALPAILFTSVGLAIILLGILWW